jgi:hypothetical protein
MFRMVWRFLLRNDQANRIELCAQSAEIGDTWCQARLKISIVLLLFIGHHSVNAEYNEFDNR